ncbi:hypothetical protein BS78_01G153000 [Paspalum vaginatum]|nr:hypothetical protein BS78_01G153000 [Paspalum vaginatum]
MLQVSFTRAREHLVSRSLSQGRHRSVLSRSGQLPVRRATAGKTSLAPTDVALAAFYHFPFLKISQWSG